MDRGRIGCAAVPISVGVGNGRKPRVRVSRFPAPDTREQALASLAELLDQHEDDAALIAHERGQRALAAAKQLANATTRIDENRARTALIAIALEETK